MAIVKERIITLIKRVKNDKSLRLKIVVFSVIVFLLYLHFKDIDNRNVELIHKVFDVNPKHSKYPYYVVSLKNNKLEYSEFSSEFFTKEYCNKNNSRFIYLISTSPIIVQCFTKIDQGGVYEISNGEWSYELHGGNRVVGENEKYLLRSDYSLIDKHTGQVLSDFITKPIQSSNKIGKIYSASTITKDGRIFASYIDKRVINEILNDGTQVKVIDLPWSFFTIVGVNTYIRSMIASDNGDYIFFISDIDVRGFRPNLYFYIVDVKNKSIIYKNKIANEHGISSIYLNKYSKNIVFSYRGNKKIHAYRLTINTK